MSRPDYGSMLERFNATDGRGDVLSFSREDAARLAELPLEIAAPILHALLKWFLTGEEVPLNDPRDRAMLAGFKEHQLSNAARRGKFLNDQKEKSDKAVQARKERTHGTPADNPRETQVIDKAKDKDKEQVKVSLSLVGDKMQDGLTPSALVPPSAEEATTTLAMDAPPITSHAEATTKDGKHLNAEGCRFANGTPEAAVISVGTKIYPDALNEVSDEVAETLQEVLAGENEDTIDALELPKSFFKTPLGSFVKSAFAIYDEIYSAYSASDEDTSLNKSDGVFKRALLDAAIGSKDPKVKSRAGFILARLKKVAAAVKVLETAKTPKPVPGENDDWD